MSENKYAKLVDGVLEFAPKNDLERNIFNYDLDEDLMIADGYKLFVPATIEPGKDYTNFRYKETKNKITELCDEVPKPTVAELAQQREEAFNREFFLTSLGYIRRTVTKANGEKADFILDYVALINKAVEKNIPYPIKAYRKPVDFTQDIVDWNIYQYDVYANEQFVLECLAQAGNDFIPNTSTIPEEPTNSEEPTESTEPEEQ